MDWRALALGLVFVVAWSSAFTSARLVVLDAPPFAALSVRFLISGLIALAIGFAAGQRIALDARQWGAVIVFGICQNALYLGLNFEALRTIEASLAVIVASLLPLVVAGLDRVVFGGRLTPLGLAGLAAGFAGAVLIMVPRVGGSGVGAGLALCVVAVVALAVATLLVRGASGGGNLWIVVGLQMLVGSLALFPVAWAIGDWQVNWTPRLAMAFTYTTLVPGLGATMIWFVLVRRIGATRAATFHFLNPFVGVATAALVLGERVGPRDFAGVAVIMLGILAVQVSRRTVAAPDPVRP